MDTLAQFEAFTKRSLTKQALDGALLDAEFFIKGGDWEIAQQSLDWLHSLCDDKQARYLRDGMLAIGLQNPEV